MNAHTAVGQRLGATEDEKWVEIATVLLATNGLTRFADGLRVPSDTDPRPSARPLVALVDPSHAAPSLRPLVDEISTWFGDGMPNAFRAMAHTPGYLEDFWRLWKAAFEDGALTRKSKSLLGYAAAVTAGSPYAIDLWQRELGHLGVRADQHRELMGIVERFSGLNVFADCLQLDSDILPAAMQR